MTDIIAKRKANNRKLTGYPPDGTPADAFCKEGESYHIGSAPVKGIPTKRLHPHAGNRSHEGY